MMGRRAPGARGPFFLAVALGLLSCGRDQEDPDGSPGATGGAAGVGQASGGQLEDGEEGGAASGGAGGRTADGGGGGGGRAAGGTNAVDTVTFTACQAGDEVIEVRGLRGGSCWLVVLEQGASRSRCHPKAARSNGWCVVEVRFSEEGGCERQDLSDSNEYWAAGGVRVDERLVIDLALDLSLPEAGWTSDVPFAVSGCAPNCSDVDCRK